MMSPRPMLLLSLACLALAPAAGAVTVTASGSSLSLSASLAGAYDSNILDYSDQQVQDFRAGQFPARYSIRSIADGVFSPALGLAWENDRGRGRGELLSLRAGGEFHARNGTADWRWGSLSLRESFTRARRLSASVYRLPHFYLRQLIDDDVLAPPPGVSRYRRAEFDLTIASLRWRERAWRRATVELGWQFERREYVPGFVERTSNLNGGSLALAWREAGGAGSSWLQGAWRNSVARAEDANPADVDPDISYHGPAISAGGQVRLSKDGSSRLVGDASLEWDRRIFDSDRPTDIYHHGREDTRWTIELGVGRAWRPHWSARASWRSEKNIAALGATAPPSADTGSYTEHRIGVEVSWSGRLWHARSGFEAPPEETR